MPIRLNRKWIISFMRRGGLKSELLRDEYFYLTRGFFRQFWSEFFRIFRKKNESLVEIIVSIPVFLIGFTFLLWMTFLFLILFTPLDLVHSIFRLFQKFSERQRHAKGE